MREFIFIDQDIEQLKKDIHGSKKPVFDRLIEQCKLYFPENLPQDHPKSSTTFMGIAMANLSLAYVLTEQEHYKDEAKRWLMTCVNYPHWGNAHLVDVDLSAAWILFGMGITYDWLKDDLTSYEKDLVKAKLLLQGKRMYDFKIETHGSGWSTNFFQNHNWINLTGLSCAGYALVEEEPEVQAWIDVSKENFDYVYSVMPEDGSDYEGVVYWRYGAMWLFVYAHLLKEREDIDYFRSCDFLRNTFDYRLYQAAPNLEEQINFGDAHDRRSGHSTAIYYKVAAEYNNGYAQKLGNLVRDEFLYREAYESKVKPGILPECFFEVLFYKPEVDEKDFNELPLSKFFPDLGLFIKRSSWQKDATHFSFKCSYPGGKKQWKTLWELKREKNINAFGLSHQHPDNNSFLLVSDNTFFAIDDGYNRSVKAADHNVVIVDGRGYVDEGVNNIWKNYTEDMVADIVDYKHVDDLIHIAGEAAKVYQKDLKLDSFKRNVITGELPYIVMIDELKSQLPHEYTWIMHGDTYPEVTGKGFRYEVGHGEMEMYHFSDQSTDYKFVDNTIRAVMTTQEPDKFTENKMKGLHIFNKDKVENMSFFTVLNPKAKDLKLDVSLMSIVGGYGVSIKYKNKEDILLYSDSSRMIFENETYHSKLLVVRKVNGLSETITNL